jgi:glycosyltransferase involved in cell wall biosynthesis
MKPVVAIVLPPREGFAPGDTGAIGLLVHRLSGFPGRFRPVVLGMKRQDPFAGVDYIATPPAWLPMKLSSRYAHAVAHRLALLQPALVEVHNRPDIALILANRLRHIPVCLHLHNDPLGMRALPTPRARAQLLASLARVVTVSDYLRQRLLQGLPPPERHPAVLPNCLDLRQIPPSPPEREPTILFAGRVVADKGADSFVTAAGAALRALPAWSAVIIGADRFGPDSPETPWLRELRPKAAVAGVAMLGYQPHDAVLAAMARAAIVVVPSRWAEPFGLTALEAMAAGAALLCSRSGGLREICDGIGEAIDPENPAAMADSIIALARDPAHRAAIGAAGRERALRFDLPAAAARLDALRQDVLGAWQHPPARPI